MSYANDSLGAIPFEHIIGTPLTAAINAQTLAAKTCDFQAISHYAKFV